MEMRSEFRLSIHDDLFTGISYPPGESTHQWVTRNFEEANGNKDLHIWLLGSHTHKYGTDFDIYVYKDNTIGQQIYEGFHNADYTIPTDFYNYAEPPFRIFDDYLTLEPNDSLFIEGKYNNTSGERVGFGLTTNDEMFGVFISYLVGDISNLPVVVDVEETPQIQTAWSLYPNPAKEQILVQLPNNNKTYQLKLFDTAGHLLQQTFASNQYVMNINNYSSGVYILQMQDDTFTSTKKLVIEP